MGLRAEIAEKLRLASFYRDVFSSDSGKAILRDLARQAHFQRAPISEYGAAMYREGQRSMVIRILRMSKLNEIDLIEQVNAENKKQDTYLETL